MSVFPLKQHVIKPGEGYYGPPDRFGNEKWIEGEPTEVPVFSFEIKRSEEPGTPEEPNRIITEAVIIAPQNTFDPQMRIEVPGYGEWEIEGYPEDVNNNPWYSPGLVTYHAKQVEG